MNGNKENKHFPVNIQDLSHPLHTILSEDFFQTPQRISQLIFDIKNNIDIVLGQADYTELLMYLRKVYVIQNDNITLEIKELLKNKAFRLFINTLIQENISSILNNDSTHSFEEISFFVFLLGFGEFNNILIDLNTYDFEKLDALFQKYIQDILKGVEVENRFESIALLLELINKLAILDQTDSQRKKLIPQMTQILEKNIHQVLTVLQKKGMSNTHKENIMNHILGKLSINFSHIEYIETENRDIDDVLKDFHTIFTKQIAGYNISLAAQFGNNPSYQMTVYHTFLGNMAYTMNVLLTKIDKLKVPDIFSHSIFQEIIVLFQENTGIQYKQDMKDISLIKEMTMDVFIGIYRSNIQIDNYVRKPTAHDIIKEFIAHNGSVDDFQIESIHHLLMFCSDFTTQDYLDVGNFLVETNKFNNYNFEFFKLKTLDFILSQLPRKEINPDIDIFFTKLTIYIENNKVASQLLNNYFRLYLSMAFYYSEIFSSNYQQRAMECYTIFQKMGGGNFDFVKYGKKQEDFFYNLGLAKVNATLCDCEYAESGCNPMADTHEKCDFTQAQITKFGKARIDQYMEGYEGKIKNDLDRILSDLLDNALSKDGIDDDEINKKISIVLSNKIFHGIAQTKILHINQDKSYLEDIILHNGISTEVVELFGEYKMLFIYPRIYQKVFNEIFENQYFYIVRNIKNIITSYLKRRDLYLDHTTGLPNELKLKTILANRDAETSFITIKLNTLRNINNGYSYNTGDEYIQKSAQALMKIPGLEGKVYRLSGAKIGVLLMNITKPKVETILSEIKNIRFSILGNTYKLDAIIGVAFDEKNRVVEKANSALSYAKSSTDGIYYYDEGINDSQKNKELLEYLIKLDTALEEDRIIPFFQPKFSSDSKKITGYEALLRIQNQEGGFDPPFKYLQSAEQFGRLRGVANRMIYKVFQYASQDNNNYSINLSGDDLKSDDLIEYIKKIDAQFSIDPSRITFEILEGEWNEGSDNLATIKILKSMGYKIAMDDFGANNSNINRLLDLLKSKYIDCLKIDGKIIKSLIDEDNGLNSISRELLSGVVKAAHSAGVYVTAEFVENEKIAMICEFLRIDELQGYHLGKPEKDTIKK